MKLTAIEKETIVLFNEQEDTAEIYTHNMKLKNRLLKFVEKRPDLASCKEGTHDSVTVLVPKSLLTISVREPVSEALRQARRERAIQEKHLPHLSR
ncbi:MAG: molecular chaperone [Clostridia bacterium]